jgi:hypothetical protein
MWVCSYPTRFWSRLHLSMLKRMGTSLRSLQFTCLCLYPIHTFPTPLLFDLFARIVPCLSPLSIPHTSVSFTVSAVRQVTPLWVLFIPSVLRVWIPFHFHPLWVYTHLSRTPVLDTGFRHCFTWLPYIPSSIWKPLSSCSLRARSTETAGPAVLRLSVCWRPHYAKYSNGLKLSLVSHKRLIRNWRTRSLCVDK